MASLSSELSTMNNEKLRYLANKSNIDHKILGNSATKFLLACNKNKSRKNINSMLIDDTVCEDPIAIGEHVFDTYNKTFNQVDPYNERGRLRRILRRRRNKVDGKNQSRDECNVRH